MTQHGAQGRFITLEGGEGTGKSTLARGLGEAVRARGRDVVLTREPGGAPGADVIRTLLVEGEPGRWSALEEALLFAAARRNHLSHTIEPALARGAVVICDRYYDSTRAYQAAGGLSLAALFALNELIDARRPDLTVILDLNPAMGLSRSRGHETGEDRFEKKDLAFHERVRAEFRAIARDEADRCVLIDSARDRDEVLREALAHVTPLL